jgi:hypothetical protein
LQLLDFLLSDAATDVVVVARERGLRDEMVARLRCALDRVNCAQEILEAIVEDVPGSEKPGGLAETAHPLDCHGSNVTGRRQERTKARVRSAFELLRNSWPPNYPDEAVEWLIFES